MRNRKKKKNQSAISRKIQENKHNFKTETIPKSKAGRPKILNKKIKATFNLDRNIIDFLNSENKKQKKSKSEIMNNILSEFIINLIPKKDD